MKEHRNTSSATLEVEDNPGSGDFGQGLFCTENSINRMTFTNLLSLTTLTSNAKPC